MTLAEFGQYVQQKVKEDFISRIRKGDLSWQEKQSCIDTLIAKHNPISPDQLGSGYIAYKAACETQRNLFTTGAYIEEGGNYLSGLPKLTSVLISRRDGSRIGFETKVLTRTASWIELSHPETFLRSSNYSQVSEQALDRHFRRVLRILSVSRAKLEEMSFIGGFQISSGVSMENIPGWPHIPDFKNVKRLALSTSLNEDDYEIDQDCSRKVVPFILTMPLLDELYIKFTDNEFILEDQPQCSQLLQSTFSELRQFMLVNSKSDAKIMCTFLQRHEKLQELSLVAAQVKNNQWRPIFTTIHDHPSIVDIVIDPFGYDDDREVYISTRCKPDSKVSACRANHDLYYYLHRQGFWTEELEMTWGT
jgi:hypothetical protein